MVRPAQDYQSAHIHALAQRRDRYGIVVPCGIDSNESVMTTFADREKEFEARFKHDQDFRFKVTSRRNRLSGLWAAKKMELTDADAETYVKDVLAAQFEPGGDKRVLDKIVSDLTAKGQTITPAQVRFELDHFAEQAKQQLMKE
jgi:hypothetical protein